MELSGKKELSGSIVGPESHQKTLRLFSSPYPFSDLQADHVVPAGINICEMLKIAGLEVLLRGQMDGHVFVDDIYVPRERWEVTFPQQPQTVSVKVVPAGGGDGKDVLRVVSVLAVISLSVMTQGLLAGPLSNALGPVWGGITAAGIGAGVGIGLQLASNALISPIVEDSNDRDVDQRYYAITGTRNRANPYGPVPVGFGENRIYPPYAALPYTENYGSESYLRVLYCIGYGEYDTEQLKIDETDLSEFIDLGDPDVFKQGYKDDITSLFPGLVYEDSNSVELLYDENPPDRWYTKSTQPDTEEITLDVTFPNGLWVRYDSGNEKAVEVIIEAQYSVSGEDTWVPFPESPMSIYKFAKHRFAVGFRKAGLSGQYDVRIRRNTIDRPPDNPPRGTDVVIDGTYWTALRSIRNVPPVNVDNVLLIAMRIKATGELNGIIDRFNLVTKRKLSTWTGSAWSAATLTRSPAWAYAEVMRGGANKRPIADAKIYGDGLLNWANNCTVDGFSLDGVLDQKRTAFEVLRNIAAVGRASFGTIDTKYTVVQDIAQTVPRQHFSPRNSWDYKGSRSFLDIPHALLIKFKNRNNNFVDDMRPVYADGYDENNASLFEEMDFWGVTDPDHVWKLGRYHIAVAELRPENHGITTDVEHLVATRGDLVRYSDDVISVSLGSGRIKAIGELGPNLIPNPYMELDSDWTAYGAAIVGQSTEQSFAGYHSWRVKPQATFQGVKSAAYSTVADTIYKYRLYVHPTSSSDIVVMTYSGDGGTSSYTELYSDLIPNAWNKIEFEITESISGPSAFIGILGQTLDAFFLDNVLCQAIVNPNLIVMDEPITMEVGKQYAAEIRKSDLTFLSANITLDVGTQTEIELSSVTGAEVGNMIYFGEAGKIYLDCILSRIKHGADLSARLEMVPYNAAILAAGTGEIPDYDPVITIPTKENRIPPKPSLQPPTLSAIGNNKLLATVPFTLSTGFNIDADGFQVYYRVKDSAGGASDWQSIPNLLSDARRFDVEVEDGLVYDFRIRSVTRYGIPSEWDYYNDYTVAYQPNVPNDITGFGVVIGGVTFASGDSDFVSGDVDFVDESGSVEWVGRDIVVKWNRPYDLWRVAKYKLEVYKTTPFTLLREEEIPVGKLFSDYLFDENYEDTNGSPTGDLTFRIWAISKNGDPSANYAEVSAEHVAPAIVTNLQGLAYRGGVIFYWDDNDRPAFTHFSYRTKIGIGSWGPWTSIRSNEVMRTLTPTEVDTYGAGASITIEIKSVDCFFEESAVNTISENASSLNIQPADIVNFGPNASKLFPNAPVISGLTVTNNSNDGVAGSAPGFIHWTSFTLWHDSIEYTIASGSSDKLFVYWKDFAPALSKSDSNPTDLSTWAPLEDYIIFMNNGGVHQKAWGNALVNQIIGAALIGTAAIYDLHVHDVHADKITSQGALFTGNPQSSSWLTDIADNTYGMVSYTAIDGGRIKLSGDGVVGTLAVGFTEAKCTDPNADQTAANPQDLSWLDGSAGTLSIASSGNLNIQAASGLRIASGGGMLIQSGGGLTVQSGGGITVTAGGDIQMQPDNGSPSKLTFLDSDGGTYHIDIARAVANDRLTIAPQINNTAQFFVGIDPAGNTKNFLNVSMHANQIYLNGRDASSNVAIVDIDADVRVHLQHQLSGQNDASLTLTSGAVSNMTLDAGTVKVRGVLQPYVNNTYASGAPSYRWTTVHTNGIDCNGTLDLDGNLDVDGGIFTLDNNPGNSTWLVAITNTNTVIPYDLHIDRSGYSGTAGYFIYCENSAESKFYMQGDGDCYNRNDEWGQIASSRALKENEKTLRPVLDDLLALSIKTYNFTNDPRKKKIIGMMVEDLEPRFPELIHVNQQTGMKGIISSKKVDILIHAFGEFYNNRHLPLKAEQEESRTELERLKTEFEALKKNLSVKGA